MTENCSLGGNRTGRQILAFAAEFPDALFDRLGDSSASCANDYSEPGEMVLDFVSLTG